MIDKMVKVLNLDEILELLHLSLSRMKELLPESYTEIDSLQRRFKIFGDSTELNKLELALITDNKKIPAIISLRRRTGLGLKEAKDIVDDWATKNLPEKG